jgi:hypothetical protein
LNVDGFHILDKEGSKRKVWFLTFLISNNWAV